MRWYLSRYKRESVNRSCPRNCIHGRPPDQPLWRHGKAWWKDDVKPGDLPRIVKATLSSGVERWGQKGLSYPCVFMGYV